MTIACDLTALPDRARHDAVGAELFPQAQQLTPLEMGYQVDFPISALLLLAEFVDGERRCCPFLQFDIQVAPATAVVELRLTGAEGVKEFLAQELVTRLPQY